jgi:hypothetical protein
VYRFCFAASALSLAIGLLTGSVLTAWHLREPPAMKIVEDSASADVPVVRIDGIFNGSLLGTAAGGVRIVAGDTPVMPNASGSFSISDPSVLSNIITVTVPEGMNFVASKRGKKYYPVNSAGGQGIVPENRVYFKTAEDAQRAGYKP